MPLCAVIWFGCYSLGTISLNLLRLREFPEAAAELQQQTRQARDDLRRRGLKDVVDAAD